MRTAIPIIGSNRVNVHHREMPVTEEEIALERLYCEELQQAIIRYELDPKNFFRLNKRGFKRKI